jgi:hypothetical protein
MLICFLTVCVTGGRAGVSYVCTSKKVKARKMLAVDAVESLTSGARFVRAHSHEEALLVSGHPDLCGHKS